MNGIDLIYWISGFRDRQHVDLALEFQWCKVILVKIFCSERIRFITQANYVTRHLRNASASEPVIVHAEGLSANTEREICRIEW